MADTDWSQFSPVNQPASGETDWSNFSPADAPKKQNKGIAADLVTDVKRGVQQLPGAVQRAVTKRTTVAGKRGRRSLKDSALQADLVQVPEDEILFKKQYY